MSLPPTTDAVEVEGMVANTTSHRALFTHRTDLLGMTLDAKFHDVVQAKGAMIVEDPLFDLEALWPSQALSGSRAAAPFSCPHGRHLQIFS